MSWEKPATAAEFVQRLRELRLSVGQPSLRRLQQLGGRTTVPSGDVVDALPRSTVSTVLRGSKLPRADFVSVFVTACLVHGRHSAEEVAEVTAHWLGHWRALYAAGDGADLVPIPDAPTPAVAPRQLPFDVSLLVGREADFAAAEAMARLPRRENVFLISGPAGVGKSAFAIRWAHRRLDGSPDGQLYVDLRSARGPHSTANAVGALLSGLGVAEADCPADPRRRVDLYRSLVADRRLLVVLDNARDAAQVRPLLATGPHCRTVITSRNRMSGLVAREGARRMFLGALRPEAARTLLTTVIGEEYLFGARAELAELAELCAYLPLVLRLAAVKFADRPEQGFRNFVRDLREGERLVSLALDDETDTSPAAALESSYCAVETDAQRHFRALGCAGQGEFTLEQAAALAGIPLSEAARLAGLLAAEHLVDVRGDRIRLHRVLQAFARAKAGIAGDEPTAACGAGHGSLQLAAW